MEEIKRCTKCVLPSTLQGISFDEDGVCNYCRSYEKNFKDWDKIEARKKAEFESVLTVISLSKSSEFYNQIEDFKAITNSEYFIRSLKDMLLSEEDKGYFIPKKIKKDKSFINFVNKVCELIHKNFFSKKIDLSQKERKDFIELFYHFLILKIMEIEKPEILSFTCKDAIDKGSAMSASFFSFIKSLSKVFIKLGLYSAAAG